LVIPKPQSKIRRIDVRFLPYRSLPTALLYFTGPGDFNQKMRMIAKKKGYKLNEYGLYKESDAKIKNGSVSKKEKNGVDTVGQIKVTTEADVFKILGLKYLPPEERLTDKL
jgi:DNA polymerase/3'-5' exonuclease PolX